MKLDDIRWAGWCANRISAEKCYHIRWNKLWRGPFALFPLSGTEMCMYVTHFVFLFPKTQFSFHFALFIPNNNDNINMYIMYIYIAWKLFSSMHARWHGGLNLLLCFPHLFNATSFQWKIMLKLKFPDHIHTFYMLFHNDNMACIHLHIFCEEWKCISFSIATNALSYHSECRIVCIWKGK